MLKKPITFSDLDGNSVTKDFYFHLSKAEFTEMELSTPGGLEEFLKGIISRDDRPAIIKAYKDLILASYGIRHEDNIRFEKSKEIRDAFEQTDAFSVLFFELLTGVGAADAFMRGIMPADIAAKLPPSDKLELAEKRLSGAIFGEETSAKPKALEEYTEAELMAMSWSEFDILLATAPGKNIPKNVLLVAMRKPK
jgi:hypothetical protein